MPFCYEVPLVNQNLQKNETIVQIADILSHLSKVSEDIFIRINKRIETNAQKVEQLQKRSATIGENISKIKGIKSAIQIFSSSKYPAKDVHKDYQTIFGNVPNISFETSFVKHKPPIKREETLEKLHIYHVQLKSTEDNKIIGLGKIPNDISSFNDVILFNSTKNPYKGITKPTSLKITEKPLKIEEKSNELGIAPASMRDRNLYSNKLNAEFMYSPDLGDVPTLDVPIDLPDLPGIADNLRYHDDSNIVIAPSNSSNVNNIITLQLTPEFENLPEILTSSPPPPKLPDPIPDPVIHTKVIKEKTVVDVIEKKETIDVIKEEKIETRIETANVKVLPKLNETTDARANLMESIRQAGGLKRLKSVNKEEQVKSQAPSGNLMADLHTKLAMRRKGISGPTGPLTGNLPGPSALSNISAMIPPPDIEEKSDNSSGQEDDWND